MTGQRYWTIAGGELQVAFMGACSRALRGELGPCPKCKGGLRSYFHAFKPAAHQGTIWVWCVGCCIYAHLPRVVPTVAMRPDPYAALSTEQFAKLEVDTDVAFLDRIEQQWIDEHPAT